MDVKWTQVNLPWEDPASRHGVDPPYPRPDMSDLERLHLDGLSVMEAYKASWTEYTTYCRANGVSADFNNPDDEIQKAMLLAHQQRCERIRYVERLVFETPPLLAWRQAFDAAKEARDRLSFKNWLQVKMVFETEDGRQFLVGNIDVSGDEGGCCPTNSITNETRIVRYCILDLPFALCES